MASLTASRMGYQKARLTANLKESQKEYPMGCQKASLTASLIPSLCVSVPRTMNLGDDPRLLELHDAEEDKKDEALSSSLGA